MSSTIVESVRQQRWLRQTETGAESRSVPHHKCAINNVPSLNVSQTTKGNVSIAMAIKISLLRVFKGIHSKHICLSVAGLSFILFFFSSNPLIVLLVLRMGFYLFLCSVCKRCGASQMSDWMDIKTENNTIDFARLGIHA